MSHSLTDTDYENPLISQQQNQPPLTPIPEYTIDFNDTQIPPLTTPIVQLDDHQPIQPTTTTTTISTPQESDW